MANLAPTNRVDISHDVITHSSKLWAANCRVSFKDKIIYVGYLYINYLLESEIAVRSHTGEVYNVKLPPEFLKVSTAHQFNCQIELIDKV